MRKKIIWLSVAIGALYIGFVLFNKAAYKLPLKEAVPEIAAARESTAFPIEEEDSAGVLPVEEEKKSHPPAGGMPKLTEKGVYLR